MKISVITVVYNNERTIANAIESVLSQTYPDIEYIVIDGASTDNTLKIIRSYENQIKKIVSEKDRGIYDAMNKGIQLASGDIIAVLNSDDLYYNNQVIEQVMDTFNSNPHISLVYGNLLYVKSDDTDKIVRKWISSPYKKYFFDRGNVPPHPSLFVKREVYQQVGLFNTRYKLAADYEFMLRAFKSGYFQSQYLNMVMVKMRLGGATNKSLANIIKGNREIIDAWKSQGLRPPFLLMPVRIIKRLAQFF